MTRTCAEVRGPAPAPDATSYAWSPVSRWLRMPRLAHRCGRPPSPGPEESFIYRIRVDLHDSDPPISRTLECGHDLIADGCGPRTFLRDPPASGQVPSLMTVKLSCHACLVSPFTLGCHV